MILFDYAAGPKGHLYLAANRDEWFRRPTEQARFWTDAPGILAGRDRSHQGTWLGVSRSGRFAAITNYREPERHDPAAPSRGALTGAFLAGTMSAAVYADQLASLAAQNDRHNGYNLLLHDGAELWYVSNRGSGAELVRPGLHGLSNHLLDTPWPKVTRGRERLAAALRHSQTALRRHALFELLADRTPAQDAELPRSTLALERERGLSASHILMGSPDQPDTVYGTRSATVISIDRHGIDFSERSFDTAAQVRSSMREVIQRRTHR